MGIHRERESKKMECKQQDRITLHILAYIILITEGRGGGGAKEGRKKISLLQLFDKCSTWLLPLHPRKKKEINSKYVCRSWLAGRIHRNGEEDCEGERWSN